MDQERGRVMMKFADLIDENIEELAALDSVDAGKLFSWGKAVDIPQGADTLRYYAGAADKIHGEVLKMSRPFHAYTLLEPIGVVGHIIPWNFPTSMFFMKASPALAAGCTMVIKPAEQTPLSALFYAHLAKLVRTNYLLNFIVFQMIKFMFNKLLTFQAGIPDGVINVVTGFGTTAGAAISSHMDIDKVGYNKQKLFLQLSFTNFARISSKFSEPGCFLQVSFTGSTEVGRKVMQAAAASNLKTVSLELGGKSPILIFDDADVDNAADLALLGVVYNKV